MIGFAFASQRNGAVVRADPGMGDPDWEDVVRSAPPMPLVRISIPIMHALSGQLGEARAAFEAGDYDTAARLADDILRSLEAVPLP